IVDRDIEPEEGNGHEPGDRRTEAGCEAQGQTRRRYYPKINCTVDDRRILHPREERPLPPCLYLFGKYVGAPQTANAIEIVNAWQVSSCAIDQQHRSEADAQRRQALGADRLGPPAPGAQRPREPRLQTN